MILDFIQRQKAKSTYKKLIKKMHETDIKKQVRGNDTYIKSQIGDLKYTFDTKSNASKLYLKDDLLFHEELVYGDLEVMQNEVRFADIADSYFDKKTQEMDVVLTSEAVEAYNKMDNVMQYMDNGNRVETSNKDGIQIKNKIGDVEYSLNYSFLGEEKDQTVIIRYGKGENKDILFKKHTNFHGDEIQALDATLLKEAQKSIANDLNLEYEEPKKKTKRSHKLK